MFKSTAYPYVYVVMSNQGTVCQSWGGSHFNGAHLREFVERNNVFLPKYGARMVAVERATGQEVA